MTMFCFHIWSNFKYSHILTKKSFCSSNFKAEMLPKNEFVEKVILFENEFLLTSDYSRCEINRIKTKDLILLISYVKECFGGLLESVNDALIKLKLDCVAMIL